MAKYYVKHTCGHEVQVELFGKTADRGNKIEWLETTLCPECYARQQAQKENKGMQIEEVEMLYSNYKNNYAECKTLSGSYDKKAKTIVVLVPVEEVEEVEEVTLTIEEIAKKANSTVAKTEEMIAKTNEELDAMIADLEKRLSTVENPTKRQLEMLDGAKMAVSLVKQYKAQQ